MEESFQGEVTYKILDGGNLFGTYTNNATKTNKRLFLEIARKKDYIDRDIQNNPDHIFGEYVCCYITYDNKGVVCDLEISSPITPDFFLR